MRAATVIDADGTEPDLLSALPPELSAMVADLLTVGDALAVARTRRDVPAVAAEALRTDGVLRRMAAARPWGLDVADLVGRVGADVLCRAWGIEGAWSHAQLLRHLERRMDRPPAGRVPFGVATCDVPDAVTLVIGPSHPANWTLLRLEHVPEARVRLHLTALCDLPTPPAVGADAPRVPRQAHHARRRMPAQNTLEACSAM